MLFPYLVYIMHFKIHMWKLFAYEEIFAHAKI